MRLVDLLTLYFGVGTACSVALYRRLRGHDRGALVSALAAVPLWPLWAPIAWTAVPDRPLPDAASGEGVRRVRAALEEAVAAVAGTPLERLFGREAAAALLDEVERVSARNQELRALLGRGEFSVDAAERQLAVLDERRASPRARASARLHLENVRRIHLIEARDARALEEVAALVAALRTQLVLVRLSGSSAEGVNDIVSELWAHMEGLRRASDEAFPVGAPAIEASTHA